MTSYVENGSNLSGSLLQSRSDYSGSLLQLPSRGSSMAFNPPKIGPMSNLIMNGSFNPVVSHPVNLEMPLVGSVRSGSLNSNQVKSEMPSQNMVSSRSIISKKFVAEGSLDEDEREEDKAKNKHCCFFQIETTEDIDPLLLEEKFKAITNMIKKSLKTSLKGPKVELNYLNYDLKSNYFIQTKGHNVQIIFERVPEWKKDLEYNPKVRFETWLLVILGFGFFDIDCLDLFTFLKICLICLRVLFSH